MTPQEAAKLVAAIESLIDKPVDGRRAGKTRLNGRPLDDDGAIAFEPVTVVDAGKISPDTVASLKAHPDVVEALYLQFRNRMIDDLRVDPVFVQLVAQQPEIEIAIEPRLVHLDGSSLRGRVARLIAAGWFKTAKKVGTCRAELARTGADPGGGSSLYDVFNAFVRDGFLTREGDGFAVAPGLKVTEKVVEAR